MKNTLVLFFFAALVALGTITILQTRRVANRQEQLTAARSEQQQTQRAAEELQADNQRLNQERAALSNQLQSATAPTPTPQPGALGRAGAVGSASPARAVVVGSTSTDAAKPDNDPSGMGNFLSKMMDDPETRRFVRDQQRQMMDPLYAPLIKQLNLTPEQASQLKDFIADNQMKATVAATSMMGGSASNRTELLASMAAEQKTAEGQIKAFLGEERYALYQDYQQTLGERMQLQQFKTQTAGSEGALTDQQTEMLLAVMKEEKQNVAAMTGKALAETGDKSGDMQVMLGQTEQMLQFQEQVNQRVFARARTVLPEPQLNSLGHFQSNQLQTMRVSLNLAKKMFAPDTGAARTGQ
jgi:FtsZ-binding cell division protein ZapB